MNKLTILIVIILFGCNSNKIIISNATVFAKMPGLINQPIVKSLTFEVVSKDSLLIGDSIVEKESKEVFKIISIFNSDNVFKENGVTLKPGKYRIEAVAVNKDFEIKNNLIFEIQINSSSKLIKPILKPNLLKK